MRVMYKSPNTLLGVIPLGSSTQTIPLRNIASVDTNTKFNPGSFAWGGVFLVAGLAFLSDSAALGILFLLLAAANLANTMSAQLDFVNQAGGRNSVKVSILEKDKLMQLEQKIQQLVFADVEGQRHKESMDMVKKYESEKYRLQPSEKMRAMLGHYLAEHRRAVAAIVERHRGDGRAVLSFSRVSDLSEGLPDWVRAEESVKRRAAVVREAAVLLEAEGVAVAYTYMPDETK